MLTYTTDEHNEVTKTARSAGAVGFNAVVPRVIKALEFDKTLSYFDYGSGPQHLHANAMIQDGFADVTAYDLNIDDSDVGLDGLKIVTSLAGFDKKYDVVYASNVLNVQLSKSLLRGTIGEISSLLESGGTFVGNYPASPRKCDASVQDVDNMLRIVFREVVRIKKIGDWKQSSPVWVCDGVLT